MVPVLGYRLRPRDPCTRAGDAPLHIRLCKVSNAFQEGHGTLAKESAEEPSAVSKRGGCLPLWLLYKFRGRFRK